MLVGGFCWAAEEQARWVNSLCQALHVERNGPLVELADGRLMTIDQHGLRTSSDDHKTWSEPQPVCEGLSSLRAGTEPASLYIVRSRSGALVIVFLNAATYQFQWDVALNQPKDCRLEVWAIRSLEGGKTWINRQKILDGYNPNLFGFIQTSQGRLVAVAPHLVTDPGRYVPVCSPRTTMGKP